MSEKDEKHGGPINPSWVIQAFIGLLLAIIGYLVDGQLKSLVEASKKQEQETLEIRRQITDLELGLRGDRFSRTDWRVEKQAIDAELSDLESRLRRLEQGD